MEYSFFIIYKREISNIIQIFFISLIFSVIGIFVRHVSFDNIYTPNLYYENDPEHPDLATNLLYSGYKLCEDEYAIAGKQYYEINPNKTIAQNAPFNDRKFLNENESNELIERLKLKDNDIVLISSGSKMRVLPFLGSLRNRYARELGLIKPNTFDLLWVVDFPLFEKTDTGWTSSHHPFTRPKDEHLQYLDTDPSKILSYAYDIVINGYEAGGGSLRIYDQNVQHKIFEVLGLSDEDIKRKFGFFIDAFQYGTPPHAGMAFGLDRLAMILGGTDNIRDVIAFPKNLSAVDPMSNCPNAVSEEQLDELGIQIKR